MSAEMMDSLFVSVPILMLVFACIGIVWSVLKKRIYSTGFIFLLLGTGIHYWGLHVGRWEGIGISLFFGGGMIFIGLITLLLTFVYSKWMAAH